MLLPTRGLSEVLTLTSALVFANCLAHKDRNATTGHLSQSALYKAA